MDFHSHGGIPKWLAFWRKSHETEDDDDDDDDGGGGGGGDNVDSSNM